MPPAGGACGFVGLRDQRHLSSDEVALARRICGTIRSMVAQRDAAVRNEVDLPAGWWSVERSYYQAYRLVVEGRYEVLNNLRLFTQHFTGYALHALSPARGRRVPQDVPGDLDECLGARPPDEWVAAYRKVTAGLPEALRVGPPRVFGEIGWCVEGKTVTHDTYACLERLVLLHEAGLLAGRRCILEIGAGYGSLAYQIHCLLPRTRYVIVDIPESLLFSAIYLSVLFKHEHNVLSDLDPPEAQGPGFMFVPNFSWDRLEGPFDLVINTLSMSEMSEPQVHGYAQGIARLVGDWGVFFEQNHDNRHEGLPMAADVIRRHFAYGVTLQSARIPVLTQGVPHCWANRAELLPSGGPVDIRLSGGNG